MFGCGAQPTEWINPWLKGWEFESSLQLSPCRTLHWTLCCSQCECQCVCAREWVRAIPLLCWNSILRGLLSAHSHCCLRLMAPPYHVFTCLMSNLSRCCESVHVFVFVLRTVWLLRLTAMLSSHANPKMKIPWIKKKKKMNLFEIALYDLFVWIVYLMKK